VLRTLLLAHIVMVVVGGPRIVGYWAKSPVLGYGTLDTAVSRLNEAIFPGFLGGAALVWGVRELRRLRSDDDDQS
jgi:hypothetical protein